MVTEQTKLSNLIDFFDSHVGYGQHEVDGVMVDDVDYTPVREAREALQGSDQEQEVKRLNVKSFDWAMPIDWVDKVHKLIYKCPNFSGHIIWCYDDYKDGTPNYGGYPLAVTPLGREVLGNLSLHIGRSEK